MITGGEGLFAQANSAATKYNQAAKNEKDIINSLLSEDYFFSVELPENTNTTEPGTTVKSPDTWDGEAVYAVSIGDGTAIPVPHGFYYVGGNLESGAVISDNKSDKYNGTDRTEHRYSTTLLGNQFVWIPCDITNYKKIDFKELQGSSWDKETPSKEFRQIEQYGGFYVGRYEAGSSNIVFSNGLTLENGVASTAWINDNYITKNILSGNVTSKAGEIPYHFANYETALALSEGMYNTEHIRSELITGTQYDVMLNYMSSSDDYSDLKDTSWGNYSNVSLTGCTGRYTSVISTDSNRGTTSAWSNNIDGGNRQSTWVLLTTGSTASVKKKNLYDVAGNLWEWTQEHSETSNNSDCYTRRGGAFDLATLNSSCIRWAIQSTCAGNNGFRVTLYFI